MQRRMLYLELIKDSAAYAAMAKVNDPYGDGKAAERVVKIISEAFDPS